MKSSLRQDHNGMSELLRVLRFHLILTVRTEDPRWQRQRINVNWKYMFALLALLHGYPISFNLYIVLNSMCMTKLSRTKTELVGTAFKVRQRMKNLPLCAHILQKTVVLPRTAKKYRTKLYNTAAEPCFVHFKYLIVLWRSRCRRCCICLNSLLVFNGDCKFCGKRYFLYIITWQAYMW